MFNRLCGECKVGHCHRRDTLQRSIPVWPFLQPRSGQQPVSPAAKIGEGSSAVPEGCFSYNILSSGYCYSNMMPAWTKSLSPKKVHLICPRREFFFVALHKGNCFPLCKWRQMYSLVPIITISKIPNGFHESLETIRINNGEGLWKRCLTNTKIE